MSLARDIADLASVTARLDTVGASSGALSNRNIIINGAMQVAQRGTSSTGLGTAEGYFTVDRFKTSVGSTTAGRFTMTQESDGPSALSGIANSIKLACTTADTSIAAGENMRIVYVIEGQDLQRLKKGTSSAESFTISFYVKGNAAATYICEVYDLDNTRHVGKTFNVTTDWNRIELTFPADTTGAITDGATGGIQITFWLHSGTTYTSGTLPATWAAVSNANRAGGLSTSFYDSTSRTFFLSGLQMEVGDTATDFEHPRSVGDEIARCQRYYNEQYYRFEGVFGAVGNGAPHEVSLPVAMRAGPTLSNGTVTKGGHVSSLNSLTNFTGSSLVSSVVVNINFSGTGNGYILFNLIADAEL